MTITLNGEPQFLSDRRSLDQLLEKWGYNKGIAVAVNGAFVPRSSYSEKVVNDGDAIEILAPMQGG